MAKGLKTLAALGGLGAAAYMMGKKKGEEDMETTGDASAGMAKDRLADLEKRQSSASKTAGKAMMSGTKDTAKDTAKVTPPVRKPKASEDTGSVRTPGRDMPKASQLRPGAKAVAEKNPGDFDRMMDERRATRGASDRSASIGDIIGAKKGGMIKSSASKRADGCAVKGKTRGRMV
jgi:hypothetical protein